MPERPARLARSAFRLFRPIATRWMDNDAYGHVNNVQYYSYFDTAVNGWLMEQGLLDFQASPVIGLVVETGCTYFESVSFPEALEAGIAGARRVTVNGVAHMVNLERPEVFRELVRDFLASLV